ncbi:amidohydrolase [Microbacterium sp. PMB16]|uniref:amidohydrolase n=1 Tax=Microbacterium sp. PMB16 TaxID=3120157 RepID=UPI003F4B31AD
MSPELVADLVLLAGTVVTMTSDSTTADDAEGIAVVSGEVVAIGSRAALQSWIGETTRVLDLPEAVLLPGFVDSHIHPVFGIELTRGADLSRCRTLADVESVLRAEVAGLAAEDWLLGWGLDPNVFGEEPVSHVILNAVAGERPAFIRFFDAHAALASDAALALGGVTGTEEFTDGSRVVTDERGHPTGYLLELQAINLVEAVLPSLSFDHRVEALYDVLLQMARAGFTSGQVQDLAPDAIELLQAIEATRDLPIRLRMSPWYVPGAPLEEVARLAELQGTRGRHWVVEGVKLMIDGTIDNGTAWLHEPDCLGESTASLWLDPEQYRRALTELDRRGIPTTTHAIGDAGIDFVVRAIDSLTGHAVTHRIEHIETMTDAALEVFTSSKATASMQPTHCTLFTKADESDNWSRRLGHARTARGFRTRDLVGAGIPLALGSDWPVAPSDAVGILADAQLRRPHDDPDAQPINPDQALTAMDALRGLTVEPYRTIGRTGGDLHVGAIADITVLDRDPRAVSPESLGAAEVLLTVVDGRVVIDVGAYSLTEERGR